MSRSDAWEVTLLMRGGATRASSVLARRGREIAVFDTGMGHHADALTAALVLVFAVVSAALAVRGEIAHQSFKAFYCAGAAV